MQLGSKQGIFKDVALITNTYASDWSWSVLLEDFDNDRYRYFYYKWHF